MLRRQRHPETVRLLGEVAGKIATKVGWKEPLPPSAAVEFLSEFYAAERAFLEREKLFGRERAGKTAPAG